MVNVTVGIKAVIVYISDFHEIKMGNGDAFVSIVDNVSNGFIVKDAASMGWDEPIRFEMLCILFQNELCEFWIV